jgi:hypothetical protein
MNTLNRLINGFKNPSTRKYFVIAAIIDPAAIFLIAISIFHRVWPLLILTGILYVISGICVWHLNRLGSLLPDGEGRS